MKIAASPSTTTESPNGAFLVPATPTTHSLTTPLPIATTLFTVLMTPNVVPRSSPLLSRRRARKSATIQLSNTLKSRLVPTPPRTRPANRAARLGIAVRAHERA